MRTARSPILAPLVLLVMLGACQMRGDSDGNVGEESPVPVEEPAVPLADPDPAGTQSPAASIIREEARGEETPPPVQSLQVTIPFGTSGTDLDERAERILVGAMESEALKQDWPVTVRGHTDSSGNDLANLRASRARAEAVAAWLVERGVDDDRIRVIAFGEQNPIAPNAKADGTPDETGRRKNRRVELEIAPARNNEEVEADSDDAANEGA